jgi:hypothetical protein
MIKVTFDTNTFDMATRPQVYAKDPNHADFVKVHEAVKDGRIEGFLCDAIVALEGIKVDDRAEVFGSTTLASHMAREGPETIHLNLRTEQPLRSPLHPKQAQRFGAALALGMKFLGAPRIGMSRVEVPNAEPYVHETEEELTARLDRFLNLAKAIEDRGLGSIQAQQLAKRLANAAQIMPSPWFKALGAARDIHETREVARAIAEWSDGDSIAAHYGYGNDIFCTGDKARPGRPSILDAANRAWLMTEFGVRFCTIRELASLL